MPALANRFLLVLLLEHHCDLGMTFNPLEEPVYVDRSETPGECEVVIGPGTLPPEHDDGVTGEGALNGLEVLGSSDIGAKDFRA